MDLNIFIPPVSALGIEGHDDTSAYDWKYFHYNEFRFYL